MGKKQAPPAPLCLRAAPWERVHRQEGAVLLTLCQRVPQFTGQTRAVRRLNRYYAALCAQWRTRWAQTLYPAACAAAAAAPGSFRPWRAELDYCVTCNSDGLLGLFVDVCETTGGAHGVTVRQGDAWDVRTGTPRMLRSFFPPHSPWRGAILAELERQARARLATGETLYYDDWCTRLRASFDAAHFYPTETGLDVFFPCYAIAPHAEGIPVFSLTREQITAH